MLPSYYNFHIKSKEYLSTHLSLSYMYVDICISVHLPLGPIPSNT